MMNLMTVTVTPENWPDIRRRIAGNPITACDVSVISDVILTIGGVRYCFSPQMTVYLRSLTGAPSLPEELRRILRQANLGAQSLENSKGLRT